MDKVIGALAWPLVFLILALVALMMFRERAGELFHGALSRVRKVSLPGGIGIEFAELLETRVG